MAESRVVADRFEVLGSLGSGATGEVLRVRERGTGRELALKLLRPRGIADPVRLARALHREFQILTTLRHPHLVAVHEFGELSGDDGTACPWFTMDLVDGKPVDVALHRGDSAAVACAADAVLEALGALHRRGLVHGDITAANVLLGSVGGRPPDIFLMDLGLAQRTGSVETGVLRGTPATLAPELLRGAPIDPRADLYALGCVLYRVVTGQDPFLGSDPWQVMRAHLAVAPTSPRALRPDLSPLLEDAILALLAKDPARRPATAEAARRLLAPLSGAAAAPASPLAAPLNSAFVGRAGELLRWRECLSALAEGSGAQIAVRGPTGSGRTRLLEEFLLEAHAGGVRALLFAPRALPPRPLALLEAVERRLAAHPAEGGELDLQAPAAERALSLLERRPTVLLVDDADDVDPASAEALLPLLRDVGHGGSRTVVVLALPEDGETSNRLSQEIGEAATLRLGALAPEDTGAMLASMLGVDALPSSWSADLSKATGGWPGAVAQVAEDLVAGGRIGPDLPLPASLAGALAKAPPSRVAHAATPAARLLLAALALTEGHSLTLAELEQLEPSAARDAEALDSIVSAGSVRRVVDPSGRVALALSPGISLRAVLASIDGDALESLHLRRAEQLAEERGREAERAHHLIATGQHGEAARLLSLAARAGLEAGLPRLAVLRADEGLVLPSDPGGLLLEAELRRVKAFALASLGLANDAAGEVDRSVDAARRTGDPGAIAESRRAAARLAAMRGDGDAAMAELEQALALFDELGEVGYGAEVLLDMGRVLSQGERPKEAETRLASALGQAQRAGRVDLEAAALVALGEGALAGGRTAEAAERFRAAERLADRHGLAAAAAARRGRVLSLEASSRLSEALDEAERLLAESRSAQRLDGEAEAGEIVGRLLIRLGRRREAQEAFRTAAARRRRLGQPHEAAALAAFEARALSERGQWRAALEIAEDLIATAGRHGSTRALADARWVVATMHAAIGDLDRVESVLPDRPGAPVADQARRALCRGCALAARGESDAAREALQEACFLARRGEHVELEVEGLLALAEASLGRGDDERVALALRRARQLAQTAGWEELDAGARLLGAERDLLAGREGAAHALEEASAAAAVFSARDRCDRLWRALAVQAQAARYVGAEADAGAVAGTARRALEGWLAAVPAAWRDTLSAHPRARELLQLERVPEPSAVAPAGAPSSGRDLRPEELDRLLVINRALNSNLEPRAVLSILVDTAVELTGAERGFVLLGQEGDAVVEVARGEGGAELGGEDRRVARGVAREVMKEGKPLLALDALGDERFSSSASLHALAIRSLLAAPLGVRGETAGAIVLDSRHAAAAFEARHLELVGRLADQAGIALANARLVDELRRQAEEIRRLNDQLRAEVEEQREQLREKQSSLEIRFRYESLVGASPAMQRVYRMLDKIVPTEIPVLITGDSGTGKDLVARVIHYTGPRREGRFVTVNCAALTETLLESELFGHRRGAYTGADRDRKGLFEQADGGTLFLDEIGEMPPHLQPKLLRAIQFGEIRRLGEDLPRQVDVRILAATNVDLATAVRDGRFREDLLYRLDVARIHLAPLRERTEDIGHLVDHLLDEMAAKRGRPRQRLEPAALRLLLRHDWPGNVRELEHELTKLSTFVDGELITELDVLENCAFHERTPATRPAPGAGAVATLEETEIEQIRQALRAAKGNRSRAAEMLGIDRSTLYRKLRRLGDLDDES